MYDGVQFMKYIWYSRLEIRRRAKKLALENGSYCLSIYYDDKDNTIEHYERRGSRWYRM